MLKYFSQVLLSISNTNPDIFRGERTNNLGGKLITVFLFDVSKTFSNIKNYITYIWILLNFIDFRIVQALQLTLRT